MSIYFCGKCNAQLDADTKKCQNCGNKFSDKVKTNDFDQPDFKCEILECKNKQNLNPVSFRTKEKRGVTKWYCDKHYIPFAKNDMIKRYGFEFCNKHRIIQWTA